MINLLKKHHKKLVDAWCNIEDVEDVLPAEQLRDVLSDLLLGLRNALASGEPLDHDEELAIAVDTLVRARSRAGATAIDSAALVLALKRPLLELFRAHAEERKARMSVSQLIEELLLIGESADQLGLMAMRVHYEQQARVIEQQREEMQELSAPVIRLWDGILTLPVIGTLDSVRTQQIMETLLAEVRRIDAEVVVLDVSAVPLIDTATAQHLLQSARAVRMMGAECIISGIQPQIAQTMVTLGIDLAELETRSSVATALAAAFERRGYQVRKVER